MAIRKWILMLLPGVMALPLAGCGGTSTNVQNPRAPALSNVSIVFQPAPVRSISLTSTTKITAVVENDSSNAGVDWSLTCQNIGNCGSLSILHTKSGSPTTYTPPASISGSGQSVTILAFASADHTKNIFTSLAITGSAIGIQGTYVLQSNGSDINGQPYQVAGVIVLNGNGGVTSGEQTTNYFDPNTGLLLSVSDSVVGGSYFLGNDGRGTLTINTADPNIGQQGIENFSFVFLSSSQLLIGTLDDVNLPSFSNVASTGTLELQPALPPPPTGGYAFSVSGTDVAAFSPTAVGGIINIDSPKTISGTGSVADQDLAGSLFPSASLSGTVSDPDPFGAVKFTLKTDFASGIQFTGYMVDSTHIKLIESDSSGSGMGGLTAGLAIGQGAATGTFTTNQAFAGKYVFGIFGQDLSGLPASLASAGYFTTDTNGILTNGFDDDVLEGFGVQISDNITGTYTLDPSGTGRVDSTINFSNSIPGPEFIFYLTGNGNPSLILDADLNNGALGAGIAYPQAAPTVSFNGRYGLNYIQSNGFTVNDATAQITADGTANTLSGIVDTNFSFSPNPNSALTGTFGAISSSGRFTAALTNTFFPTPAGDPNTLPFDFYLIDSAQGIFIENDLLISGQLTFGYFATRLPTCPSCP